jgi:hypothetical protein
VSKMGGEVELVPSAVSAELEALRARIAALQAELAEVQAAANLAVAEAQERTYWLDRWHLDLNALMQRPGASEFRAAIRFLRAFYRLALRLKRALRSS